MCGVQVVEVSLAKGFVLLSEPVNLLLEFNLLFESTRRCHVHGLKVVLQLVNLLSEFNLSSMCL